MNEYDAAKPANGLHRKDSMLARGLSALKRRQSMIVTRKAEDIYSHRGHPHNINLNDTEPPLSMMTVAANNVRRYDVPNTATNLNRSRSMLGRARSFKYPEKVSHIPPPEITRLRSKSQVRDGSGVGVFSLTARNYGDNSYDEMSDEIMYTSGGFSSSSSSGKNNNFGYASLAEITASSSNPYHGNYGQSSLWLARQKVLMKQDQNNNLSSGYFGLRRSTSTKPPGVRSGFYTQRPLPRRRDLSEPTPPPPPPPPPIIMPTDRRTEKKRRQPLPDIFYYGHPDDRSERNSSRSIEKLDER